MKRLKEFDSFEKDQRKRLNDVQKRLDKISKGGRDIDGYTSSPEETTFIVILVLNIKGHPFRRTS